MVDAEKRTKKAIILTREILLRALDEPGTMVLMTAELVEPEEVEDKITEILEYFEKTNPEEPEDGQAV